MKINLFNAYVYVSFFYDGDAFFYICVCDDVFFSSFSYVFLFFYVCRPVQMCYSNLHHLRNRCFLLGLF